MSAVDVALATADRVAIAELCARYSQRFDAGDGPGCASLFAPDGAFIGPGGKTVEGREQIAAMVMARHEQMPELRHFATAPVVEVADERVRASAYVLALRLAEGGELRLLTIGRYDDELVRVGGDWCYQTRRYEPWLTPELSDRAVLTTAAGGGS